MSETGGGLCGNEREGRGTAAGPDGILAKILKACGYNLLQHIHALTIKIWDKEAIPTDFRDALIVIQFKNGDMAECGNYKGISLLSTTGKIIACILFKGLHPAFKEILPESQKNAKNKINHYIRPSSI